MGLREYVIRRSIYMFLLIIAIVCFNFFLFRLPTFFFGADPIDLMISDNLKRTPGRLRRKHTHIQIFPTWFSLNF